MLSPNLLLPLTRACWQRGRFQLTMVWLLLPLPLLLLRMSLSLLILRLLVCTERYRSWLLLLAPTMLQLLLLHLQVLLHLERVLPVRRIWLRRLNLWFWQLLLPSLPFLTLPLLLLSVPPSLLTLLRWLHTTELIFQAAHVIDLAARLLSENV